MINVLVTNDDGVDAPGIKALASELAKQKNVRVTLVAPLTEQSSVAHAISLRRPLRLVKKRSCVYAVEGTTIDSVFAGVWIVMKKKPDFIFSGINRGGNLGEDIHYSGTVAAAVEGGIMGIPSVALSQLGSNNIDYKNSALFATQLLKKLINNPLPAGVVLNVNFPEKLNLKQIEVTKTGRRDYGGKFIERTDPRGERYFWIGGDQYNFVNVKNSDCNAIQAGKISVSPLQVDMTSYRTIKNIKEWLK